MDPEPAPSPKIEDTEPGATEGVPISPTGEKRKDPDGDGGVGSPLPPSPKKPRSGAGDLGRVAEIVLVLSAMGRMRGGRDPTEVELGLMAEAREKLAAICETLAPKDIVAKDAVGRVIEDLGLTEKARDKRMGFKVPKLSIAEKLAFTRRKMDEAKKYPTHTTTYMSPPVQGSLSTGADSRGTLTVRTYQSDKPPDSSGGIWPSPPLGNATSSSPAAVPLEKSTSVTYHFSPSEVRTSTVSTALSGSQSGRDSSSLPMPKVERSPDVVEIGSNLMPRPSVVQGTIGASSSVNQPSVSAPTWSFHSQPTSLSRFGLEKNAPDHAQGKAQEASNATISTASPQVARDQTRRPHLARASSVQPPTMHAVAPLNPSNHYEIAKIVQRFLPPKLPEHPTWTPPSREYMNRALTCQICQITVNDVESVLLCDACEKGYHLKCLQSQNQRGIPKVEWHCQKCLALSHGKPLPPKYGRVMRNTAAPKVPANVNTVQLSEKRVGTADSKSNQQKSTDSAGSQNPAGGAGVSNTDVKAFSDSHLPKGDEKQDNNPSIGEEMQLKSSENNSTTSLGSASGSPDGTSNQRPTEDANKCEPSKDETRPDSRAMSETPVNETDVSSSLSNPLDKSGIESAAECSRDPPEICEKSNSEMVNRDEKASFTIDSGMKQDVPHAEHIVDSSTGIDAKQEKPCSEDVVDHNTGTDRKEEKSCVVYDIDSNTGCDGKQEKPCGEGTFDSTNGSDAKQDDLDAELQDPDLSFVGGVATSENAPLPSDVPHGAEWIGDALELVDGKAFYGSCCIAGLTYKLNQHALLHFDHGKLVPSKLQAMWEDKSTGMKWVKVNRCYFPNDLPENVGRPFTEANEVFESNHEETFMAGSIQSPCEVLNSTKYKEETERRSHDANVGLTTPVFLCKWFYDESKGHFQAVSG